MASVPTGSAGVFPPERLADRLVKGRLPLLHALRCAADLAVGLRDLHHSGAVHGSVTPVFVALEPFRAVLLEAPGSAATGTLDGDVRFFGAVLYEMLVGRKPGDQPFAPAAVRSPYHGAWAEVYQSALSIAEKCMAATPNARPEMQKVANELRLLLVIANRSPAPRKASVPPAPAPQSASRAAAPPAARPAKDQDHDEDDEEGDWEDGGWDDLTDLFCPACGTQDVHYSSVRTTFERFLDNFGVPFYRCHRCFHRYIVFLGIRITMVSL